MAMTQTPAQETSLEALHAKLDAMAQQMDFLAREMEEIRRQREVWTDLGRDLSPVLESIYMIAVEQLEELSPYVQLEDLWRLVLRFLRSARLLDQLLQELETLHDLVRDLSPIAHDATLLAIKKLDEMEKRGYFALLREITRMLDELTRHITPEDVRRLREALMEVLEKARQDDGLETSLWGLLRLSRDPEVRRGMALGLHFMRAIGRLAASPQPNGKPSASATP